jgi:autophagy-related protein 5
VSATASNPPPPLPWRLVVSDGPDWDTADTFLNSLKEAAYVRDGTAKHVMALSNEDTAQLWSAVRDNDYASYARVNARLLGVAAALRNVPIRLYVPSSPPAGKERGAGEGTGTGRGGEKQSETRAGLGIGMHVRRLSRGSSPTETPKSKSPPPQGQRSPTTGQEPTQGPGPGTYKVVQSLIPPQSPSRQPTLLGSALRTLLPTLFPSSRDPVLANVILHGAAVPFSAPIEDLMREAAYPDGWLCFVVVLL